MATTRQRSDYAEREARNADQEFLDGQVRSPYQHTPVVNPVELCTCDSYDTMICAQCRPIISRYADPFKTMVHQGTSLKKQKCTTPTLSTLIPFHTGMLSNKMIGCSPMFLTLWGITCTVVPASVLLLVYRED